MKRKARGEDLDPGGDGRPRGHARLPRPRRRRPPDHRCAFAPAPSRAHRLDRALRALPRRRRRRRSSRSTRRAASAARPRRVARLRGGARARPSARWRGTSAGSCHLHTSNGQVNAVDRPRRLRPAHADDRAADRAVPVRRACRGSTRPSGATASSRRWRCLWLRPAPRPRRARATWRRPRRPSVIPEAGRRARQDPARDAQRRDGDAPGDAVRALLRQRRCDAALRAARGRLLRAHRRPRLRRARSGRTSSAALDWIDALRRPRRRRLRRVPAAVRRRAAPPGLEGLRRRRLPRRRHAGRGPIALCEVQGYVYAARRRRRRLWPRCSARPSARPS